MGMRFLPWGLIKGSASQLKSERDTPSLLNTQSLPCLVDAN